MPTGGNSESSRGRHQPSTGVGQALTPLGAERGLRWAAATQPREHKLKLVPAAGHGAEPLEMGGISWAAGASSWGFRQVSLEGKKGKKRAKGFSTFTKFPLPNLFILAANWLISRNMTEVTLMWHIWLRLSALKIRNWEVMVPTATTGSNYPGSANFENRRNICFLQPSKCTARSVSAHSTECVFLYLCLYLFAPWKSFLYQHFWTVFFFFFHPAAECRTS